MFPEDTAGEIPCKGVNTVSPSAVQAQATRLNQGKGIGTERDKSATTTSSGVEPKHVLNQEQLNFGVSQTN